jgi:hypothetical protein
MKEQFFTLDATIRHGERLARAVDEISSKTPLLRSMLNSKLVWKK